VTTSEQPAPEGDEQPPQAAEEGLDDSDEAQDPDAGTSGKNEAAD